MKEKLEKKKEKKDWLKRAIKLYRRALTKKKYEYTLWENCIRKVNNEEIIELKDETLI